MACNIPRGWYYAGRGYTFRSEHEAKKSIPELQRVFPDNNFDVICDTHGGENYIRWIVITDVDPIYGKFVMKQRKIKKSKTKKLKRKITKK